MSLSRKQFFMFRFLLIFLPLFPIAVGGFCQIPHGTWRDHFSFAEGKSVCSGNGKVYCASDVGLFTYNLSNGEIDKLTKIEGLSAVGVSAIAYFTEINLLAVGYESGNIDLVYSNQVVNIPFIKDKTLSGSKAINSFTLYEDKIYTSTDFGIVVIDPAKKEIKDTYFLGQGGTYLKVTGVAVFNNRFWAATANGLLSALDSDPLLVSSEHWTKESFFADLDDECIDVASSSNVLFAVESQGSANDILWRFDGSGWNAVDRPYTSTLSVKIGNGNVLVTSNSGIALYSELGIKTSTITAYSFASGFKPNSAIPVDAEKIAIADSENGLVVGTVTSQISVKPRGPISNRSFSIGVSSERVIVAAGAYDAVFGNFWYAFTIHRFVNEQWTYYSNWDCHDAVAVEFDPSNPSNYYVASWGGGVLQFQGDNFVTRYSPDNSTLQTIYPNAPFCRISGLTFDSKGNLWVANAMVANPISVRKTDGTWASFPYASAINSDYLSTLHYAADGTLWLILPKGGGLFALNPGSSVDSKDDDLYRKMKPFDSDGNIFSVDINALAFDRDGYLWLGTSQGVLLSYNPDRVFSGGFYLQRVKIPDKVEGLAVYLLETESVKSVTVDGGNRKWFGTEKSGAYLFSSDGTDELLHFTEENSPLPSNNILDIKIHPTTGEVFFATDKGLVSYRGDASEPGNKFGKVYPYPNPVPPGYSGVITITGLVENTIVKITDINGNLIYETKSNGGMATWDGRSLRGHRVATGVYLVFCADSKGDQTAVTKILFIK